MEIRELEKKLHTSISRGLTNEEAQIRLKQEGFNELKEEKKTPLILIFLHQFNDVLIYVLLMSGIISLVLKETADAIIIFVVVLVNGIVGFIQEEKASKAIEALKKIATNYAIVKRDNKVMKIPTREVVVGDIILVREGQAIPSDAIIIKSNNLLVDESALTGESDSVLKDERFISKDTSPIAERLNYLYMSTFVLQGNAEAIVISKGMNTEIGKIADMLKNNENQATPLQKKLEDLGKMLGVITLIVCVLLFVLAIVQKRNVVEMFITSISLAVAAVPEGLPAVVTIVLALGVQKLVKSNMVVRKLHSVETLGAVSKVLTDKTGTLTENQMTVASLSYNKKEYGISDFVKDESFDMLCEVMQICNNASISNNEIGNPTEIALKKFSEHFIKLNYQRLDEIPFSSERKMMSVLVKKNNIIMQYTKGAYEKIIEKCDRIFIDNKEQELDEFNKNELERIIRKMSSKALRVIALAYKKTSSILEDKMVFVGLVGMIDPPKKGVKEAIKTLKEAHIDTIMITGDNIITAFAIAKNLEIATSPNECISGQELDKLSEKQMKEIVKNKKVFARVSPTHKVKIVKAFKDNDYLVTMTGDGVNDAPSLKTADVGIAMGKRGTDVAKNAADMILLDDNYGSLAISIKEGRGIYANIKKTSLFLLSSNFAEVLSMLLGVILFLPMPLLAVHILWINLITDSLPAIALGVDKTSDEVMKEKPRAKNESLFAHGGYSILFLYGAFITIITMISFFIIPTSIILNTYGFDGRLFAHIRHILLTNEGVLLKSQTFAFTTLSLSQLFHMIGMSNVKNRLFSIIKDKNYVMLLALVIGIALQVLVTEVPFLIEVFKTSSLSLSEWIYLLLISSFPLIMHEIMVSYYRKK